MSLEQPSTSLQSSFKIDPKIKKLPGSPVSLLSQLELGYTMDYHNMSDALNLWMKIVQAIINDCQNLNEETQKSKKKTITTNTWQWRRQIDKHVLNIRRLRASNAFLLFMLPAFEKYWHCDDAKDNKMWFHCNNDLKNDSVARWILPVESGTGGFDPDTGFCQYDGAKKFWAKFGFQCIVDVTIIKGMLIQWEYQWSIYNTMHQVVLDYQRKNWHKMTQWMSYLNKCIEIAQVIKHNRFNQLNANNNDEVDEKGQQSAQ